MTRIRPTFPVPLVISPRYMWLTLASGARTVTAWVNPGQPVRAQPHPAGTLTAPDHRPPWAYSYGQANIAAAGEVTDTDYYEYGDCSGDRDYGDYGEYGDFLRATAGSAGNPFFHLGMMRVDWSIRSDAQAVGCFYHNDGHNHSSSTVKVLKSFTGGVYYCSDIVWIVPRTPVLTLPPSVGAGGSVGSVDASALTTTPGFTETYMPPSQLTGSQPGTPQPSLPPPSHIVTSQPSLSQLIKGKFQGN